jgi:DNA-binding NtrC family response regulator
MLHERGRRAGGPFVAVNCAAIPEALFEAELFGARRGAYTGALQDRPGLMQAASGGTLFLDEVGELPLSLQPKLLRAAELREARPVGDSQATRVDLRLVAASNRDLEQDVASGRFREDLYHRVRGATVRLPPLRERREDVALLARVFLARVAARDGGAPSLTAPAMERLLLHAWRGNVRELERVCSEAAVEARIRGALAITVVDLRVSLLARGEAPDAELASVREALSRAHGNVVRAAAELGVSRAHLYRVLQASGLRAEDFR